MVLRKAGDKIDPIKSLRNWDELHAAAKHGTSVSLARISNAAIDLATALRETLVKLEVSEKRNLALSAFKSDHDELRARQQMSEAALHEIYKRVSALEKHKG